MRLLHISDNHSILYPLEGIESVDAILHTGDFLPNKSRGNRKIEPIFQNQWINFNIEEIKKWLGGKVFLFVPGNHDFIDVCSILNKVGIKSYNLTERCVTFGEHTFYGFPYIPWMGGEWNYELFPQQMIQKIDNMVNLLNVGKFDILAAHCPIYGIMDKNKYGQNCGNSAMKNAFEYKITKYPKLYAHGHIHENSGIQMMENTVTKENMIISNAATTQRIIEI